MYEAHIEIMLGEIETQCEDEIVKVVQSYGFNINKKELQDALNYDRNQYAKGYREGFNDAIDKIRESTWSIGYK